MELELFTVFVKGNGIVHIDFNEALKEVASEEEILKAMEGKMDMIIPAAQAVVDFLKSKINP